jgi:hypothetical protein
MISKSTLINFLNPLLLLGAIGIALPILAHLLNKHQFKQTDWATMQFLNRAVNVHSRPIKLRVLLLLAPRCAGILLIVFAITNLELVSGVLRKGTTAPRLETSAILPPPMSWSESSSLEKMPCRHYGKPNQIWPDAGQATLRIVRNNCMFSRIDP